MAIYNNEEERKRRTQVKGPMGDTPARVGGAVKKAARRAFDTSPGTLPARSYASGLKEAGEFVGSEMRAAARRPTPAGRAGAGLRTLITAPVAFAAGAAREPVGMAVGAGKQIASGARSFARGLTGAAPLPTKTEGVPNTATTSAMRTSIGDGDATTTSPAIRGDTPGSGTIMTGRGSVRFDPATGEVVTAGDPTVSDDGYVPAKRAVSAGPTGKTRMVKVAGGYRLPERELEPEPALRQLSDIRDPRTMGDLLRYKREAREIESDRAAFQKQQAQEQQQAQFEAGLEQEQGQFEDTQASEQERFQATEGRLSRAEERAQGELALRQQRLEDEQQERQKLDDAIQNFSLAETPRERQAAAQKVNALSGKGMQLDKKTKAPAWKPKEVSDALGEFRDFFAQQKGKGALEEGSTFFSLLQSRDPGLYKAAYGDLSPGAADFGERVMTFPLEKLKADPKFKQLMETTGRDMTPEELQATLIADYVAGTQAGAAR